MRFYSILGSHEIIGSFEFTAPTLYYMYVIWNSLFVPKGLNWSLRENLLS